MAVSKGSQETPKAGLRRHGRSTREAPEIVRHPRSGAGKPLGRRIRARFAAIGLDEDVPELRGEAAQPTMFEK